MSQTIEELISSMAKGFETDPADTDYQSGFEAALHILLDEIEKKSNPNKENPHA